MEIFSSRNVPFLRSLPHSKKKRPRKGRSSSSEFCSVFRAQAVALWKQTFGYCSRWKGDSVLGHIPRRAKHDSSISLFCARMRAHMRLRVRISAQDGNLAPRGRSHLSPSQSSEYSVSTQGQYSSEYSAQSQPADLCGGSLPRMHGPLLLLRRKQQKHGQNGSFCLRQDEFEKVVAKGPSCGRCAN